MIHSDPMGNPHRPNSGSRGAAERGNTNPLAADKEALKRRLLEEDVYLDDLNDRTTSMADNTDE